MRNDDLRDVGRFLSEKYDVSEDVVTQAIFDVWFVARTDPNQDRRFWSFVAEKVGISSEQARQDFRDCPVLVPEIIDLARKLSEKYTLGMLSNHVRDWHQDLMERCGVDDLFGVVVTSYSEGVAKPDAEVYKRLLQKLRVDPEEVVYIDDSAKNLEPAKKIGMKVIHFKNYQTLVRDLSELGVDCGQKQS